MATVYLAPAPTGDDTRTYAQAQNPATPWATISKVNTSATTGDTVVCLNGTYPWVTQTFTKSFTIQPQNAGQAIFDASGAARQWIAGGAAIALNFTDLVFQNITGGSGIFRIGAASTAFTFLRCTLKTFTIDSAYGSGSLFDNTASGTITCTDCLFNSMRKINPSSGAADAMMIVGGTGNTLALALQGCTMYLDGPAGSQFVRLFWANQGTMTLTVKNTIIQNAGASVAWAGAGSGGVVNSTVTYSDLNGTITGAPAGAGNITSDPLFTDPVNSNFRLRPTSPCLGTGVVV